jgi:hypothetical protein
VQDEAVAGPAKAGTANADGGSSEAIERDGGEPLAKDGGPDARGASDGDAGDPETGNDDPAPLCATLSVGTGERLPISTADDDRGLSVTPSGLAAAWITGTDGSVTIHYVDRADTSTPFDAERTITGAFAAERVALTPDGLGLAVVNSDRLGFSLLSRASATNTFGAPSAGPFSNLNDQGVMTYGPAGLTYADPVFARSGAYLFFSRRGGPSTEPTVLVATHFLATDPFSFGAPFAESALMPVGNDRRIVTSMSSDLRTLFVWDEAVKKTRAVMLSPSFDVTGTADLGTMKGLQASTDCRTVYFVQNGDLYRYATP